MTTDEYRGWTLKPRAGRGIIATSPDKSDIKAFNSADKAIAYIDGKETNE
ncbi:hypothetical protein [Corynebacterium provencense]|nr:hypothetical protein [Corynebacterium provencense]